MCEVCAVFGVGEHWSDSPAILNAMFPAKDIQQYRAHRAQRIALINKVLEPTGVQCFDWDGERYGLEDKSYRQGVADNLTDVWKVARQLSNKIPDPLKLAGEA